VELDKLDIRQMKLLLMLTEKQSISRTADSLNVSQQAVSLQLKNLRAIFHDQLFIRSGHGVVPTPRAEQLAVTIKNIMRDLEALAQPELFNPSGVEQTFIISATDYAQHALIIDLVREIQLKAPGLKIVVRNLEIDTLEQSFQTGATDLVLTIPEFLPENIPFSPLFSETYVCVSGINGPEIRITELEQLNHFDYLIVSPSRPNLRSSSESWFKKQGINRRIVASIPSFSMIPHYLAASGLLAFIPSRLLPDEKLQTIELPASPPGFDLVVAWHPKTSRNALHQWVIAELQQLAAISSHK